MADMLIEPDLGNRYTKGEIIRKLAMARDESSAWHKEIMRWRRLYAFDHYNKRPKMGETQYPDPTPTNVVDVAVGIFTANDIEWRATSWTPEANEKTATSKVEKFLAGALTIASEREQYHVPYEIFLHAARDGAYVIRSLWDPALHSRYQTQVAVPAPDLPEGIQRIPAFRELPLRTEVIDPLEIYLLPGGEKRWQCVFREVEMSVYDAEANYNFTHPKHGHLNITAKLKLKGKLVDYWSVDPDGYIVNAALFDNEFIPGFEPMIMEGYEDIPYTIGFFKPVSRSNSKDWGHSIIQPLETSVALLEKSINRRARQIDVYTGLPLVIKALPGRTVQMDPGFGHSVNISPEEEIAFPLWPGNAPDVREHIDFMRARVQQSGFSDVMFGGANAVSGFALSQLSDQNRIRLQQPAKHLELFWSAWAKKVLRLVRNFAADAAIRVYGRFRGQDFAEQIIGEEIADFMVRAKLKPEHPNEKVRKHAMATQAAGHVSEWTLLQDYYDIEQPDDELRRKTIEEARNHPIVRLYGLIGVLQERAEEGDQAAEAALQIIMQQGVPGMTGRPGPARRPEQPMGLQSSTGQATRQAGGGLPPGQSFEDTFMNMVNASPGMEGQI